MDYVLNEYHRDISNQDLLDDIKRVAAKLNKSTLTQVMSRIFRTF